MTLLFIEDEKNTGKGQAELRQSQAEGFHFRGTGFRRGLLP
ncbi:hypothetical protein HMPREF1986_00855 [Oribacterium sp. oral taxon 078 str. F0263]|nr:hypothetical protein HMPREF1986_00855 [Oribacterium sp. oral taxon 078 str. F0263]